MKGESHKNLKKKREHLSGQTAPQKSGSFQTYLVLVIFLSCGHLLSNMVWRTRATHNTYKVQGSPLCIARSTIGQPSKMLLPCAFSQVLLWPAHLPSSTYTEQQTSPATPEFFQVLYERNRLQWAIHLCFCLEAFHLRSCGELLNMNSELDCITTLNITVYVSIAG